MNESKKYLDRRAAVAQILENRVDALVITGLGAPSYDVMAAGDHDNNFYLWGAMGGAAMVGLGLALSQPERPVWVITGDGEQLMGMGGLATIGVAKPDNLVVIVLNNEHYGETGMQRSHLGRGVDLVAGRRRMWNCELSAIYGCGGIGRTLREPARVRGRDLRRNHD